MFVIGDGVLGRVFFLLDVFFMVGFVVVFFIGFILLNLFLGIVIV